MEIMQILIASVNYSTEAVIALFCFLILILNFFGSKKGQPWNWPFIGMLNLWFPISTNVFDNFTKVLERNNGTFMYQGPWFTGRNGIITSDPSNFQHILSSKFSNYPKGSDTYTLFEPYGEFLFTLDFDEWRCHRKILHGIFSNHGVQQSNPKIHMEIFKNEMIPVLNHASEQGLVLDLKEVFKRLFLDITIMSVTGCNHGSLNINFLEEPVLKAMVNVNQGILFRHVLPERIWKLQRWLGIGQEKKVIEASKVIEELVSKYDMEMKKKLEGKSKEKILISKASLFPPSEDYLRKEFIKGLIFASVDTTSVALSWFFWLIRENPIIETKIRQEINTKLLSDNINKSKKLLFVDPEEVNKLVYLHVALLEVLRLYPPGPLQSRTCDQTDILPSGHRVESGMKVTLNLYAMARMKSVWGEDCCKYNPERWISEKNGGSRILPISSSKFCSFSSGSRICPGKELGILRLKSIAATIMHNYDIQLLKDCLVTPSTEIFLEMKNSLHARIKKRSSN